MIDARETYPYLADRAIEYGGVIGAEMTRALNEIDWLRKRLVGPSSLPAGPIPDVMLIKEQFDRRWAQIIAEREWTQAMQDGWK